MRYYMRAVLLCGWLLLGTHGNGDTFIIKAFESQAACEKARAWGQNQWETTTLQDMQCVEILTTRLHLKKGTP